MFATATVTTLYLAAAIGAYMLAAGIGLFARPGWRDMLGEFERSRALTLLGGALAFAIGAAILGVHNLWTDPLAIIVSAVGWLAMVEGLVLLAVPSAWFGLVRPILSAERALAVVAILLGLLLLAAGLLGRADPLSL